MKRIAIGIIIGAFACATLAGAAHAAPATASNPAAEPVIHIEDVERFYKIYDAAGGHPTAEQLQHDYIDPGSDGLHHFAKVRNVSGTTIAATLAKQPNIYSDAKRCMAVLPRVRQRVEVALRELGRLYPEEKSAPVTIAVGRGKPVGVTDAGGVMIGLEALCGINWLNPNVEDRFVHVLAHEYGHVQQVPAIVDDEHATVLEASLMEGIAEFTAEMISGSVAYSEFTSTTKGREKEIESAFVADEDKTDLSAWLYNATLDKPGDLGYWVGYRIAKAYYQHADDKRRAFREMMEMTDPKGFVAKSGWYPGIRLR